MSDCDLASLKTVSVSEFRLPKIKEFVDTNDPGAVIIPFSGLFETKLAEMEDAEQEAYIKETGVSR